MTHVPSESCCGLRPRSSALCPPVQITSIRPSRHCGWSMARHHLEFEHGQRPADADGPTEQLRSQPTVTVAARLFLLIVGGACGCTRATECCSRVADPRAAEMFGALVALGIAFLVDCTACTPSIGQPRGRGGRAAGGMRDRRSCGHRDRACQWPNLREGFARPCGWASRRPQVHL